MGKRRTNQEWQRLILPNSSGRCHETYAPCSRDLPLPRTRRFQKVHQQSYLMNFRPVFYLIG